MRVTEWFLVIPFLPLAIVLAVDPRARRQERHHRHRDHVVAGHRAADPRPGADAQGAPLRRAEPRARRVEPAPDAPSHPSQRLAADPRQHHADRARRDPLRDDALVPRSRRPARGRRGGEMLDEAFASGRHRQKRVVVLPAAGHRHRARRPRLHARRPCARGSARPAVAGPPRRDARPLLSVRDLHVTYRAGGGGVPAVRGVDFDLDRGETLGIAGESGCGKSTVAGALLRLLPAGHRGHRRGAAERRGRARRSRPGGCGPCAGPSWRSSSRARCTRSTRSSGSAGRSARRSRRTITRRRDQLVRSKVSELLEVVGIPARRDRRLPPPALRRAAAAGADRARAGLQPEPADRRRADDCARRDGAGAGARACSRTSSAISASP